MDLIYIILAILLGSLLTLGVGANDLANILSTTVGSHAISLKRLIILTIIFEIAGALFGSESVANTLRTGIINTQLLYPNPLLLVQGMLAVLLATSIWMLSASFLGLPVSITNAIIGAMVGFGSIILGMHAIYWTKIVWIMTSWVISPLLSATLAFFLFRSIQYFILDAKNPDQKAQKYIPFYFFLVSLILNSLIILKVCKHFHCFLSTTEKTILFLITSLLMTYWSYKKVHSLSLPTEANRFVYVENLFRLLMLFTASAMVFAHGANDVAVAIGPMSIVIDTLSHQHTLNFDNPIQLWMLFLGSIGMITGFIFYGRNIIETVGAKITTLTPSRAFAATLAAASTIIIANNTGIPISATQTLVGAVLGVGLARGIGALNLSVVRNIFMSWIITLPATAFLTIIAFYLFYQVGKI